MRHHRRSTASAVSGIVALVCFAVVMGMGLEYRLRAPVVVEKQVVVTVHTPPVVVAAKRVRATLAQVRKDWGIEGPLECQVLQK
jgi:hypothetical protein